MSESTVSNFQLTPDEAQRTIYNCQQLYALMNEIVRTLQLERGPLRDKCTALVDKIEYGP